MCIRGQVRVKGPISGSIDGLMIIDSLGGEPLAERIGETSGWRQFALYRAATSSGNHDRDVRSDRIGRSVHRRRVGADGAVRRGEFRGQIPRPLRSPAPMASQPLFAARSTALIESASGYFGTIRPLFC